ncbi:MAG: signal peptidase I [Planctomycetota bacterium]
MSDASEPNPNDHDSSGPDIDGPNSDGPTAVEPAAVEPAAPKEPPPGAAPPRDPSSRKKRKKKVKKTYDSLNAYLWHEWVRPLGTIIIVLGVFRSALLDWNDVPSGSMEPSVMTGDRIGVDKRAFGLHVPFTKDAWIGGRWGRPHRGEIVVAYSPDPNDQVRIVKRVVGVPGDTVEVRNGRLILNGEPIEYREAEPEVAGRYLTKTQRALGTFYEELLPTDDPDDEDGFKPHYVRFNDNDPKQRTMELVTLGEDEYLFIGDNRDESKDGRVYGVATEDRIVGRAFGVAFSLNHKNYFLPRVTRFFSGLK